MHRANAFPCTRRVSVGAAVLPLAFAIAMVPRQAYADPASTCTVVVTEADEGLPDLVRLAEAVDAELDRREVPHVRLAAARGQFETRHSREPMPASNEDVDLLLEAANRALAAAANADWKTALKQVRIALAKGTGALESLNRNYRNAQHIFHACLLAVQGFAESGNDPGARRQAIECIARSPGLELSPDNRDYPPFVRTYLEEARETLDQAQTAPLIVTSEPPGCGVYINGRRRGTTPYRQDNPARNPYLVQVECADERPGRVHTVTPGDQTPAVHVDTKFENAIATDGGILRLRYPPEVDSPHVRDHVIMLAEVLGADSAIMVTRPYPDRLALTRHQPGGTQIVQVRKTFTAIELQDALNKLLVDAPLPAEPQGPVAQALQAPLKSSPERNDSPRSVRVAWIGASLSMLGAGAAVSSWTLYTKRRRDGQAFRQTLPTDPAYLDRAQHWLDARRTPYLLAASGSAVFTAGASTLALSLHRRRYPWWVYTGMGAAGLALVGWGTADIVGGGPCGSKTTADRRSCVLDQERRDRGGLLMLTAVPFLATPAVHFLAASRPDTPVALYPTVGPGSWGLTFRVPL